MKECQLCKKCYTDDVATCPTDGMPTMHTISGEPVLEGKYHLEKRLGQGGMGVVYCARHAYLKTQHAIKVILPDLVGNDPQLVTRFRQEALAAAAIRHQNVVSTTDYGVAMGTMPFLVMEYVEGESLHDLLTREGRLAPEKALDLMTAICAGIGAAHSQGIVHRDLKPLNIMICKDKATMSEAVKILDFGLAKIKSGELLGSFIQAQTTGLMGSPYYMAPEQWSDEDLDGRSDIYSLGVMLFQMLTGDVPFKGSSIPAIMKKHLSDPPPTFADVGLYQSPQLELAVRHTLEKEPQKRTATVEIMVGELRAALGLNQTATGSLTNNPILVSALSVLTTPPKAKVFIDNVAVGQSKPDGLLFIDGIQSGNHHLRVVHDGFEDWEENILCDGKPRQVVAKLSIAPKDVYAIPKPSARTMPAMDVSGHQSPPPNYQASQNTPPNLSGTQKAANLMNQTVHQHQKTGQHNISVASETPKKSFISPIILGIIGISTLLLLALIGIGGAYLFGFFGNNTVANSNNAVPTPNGSPTTTTTAKAEMVKITGGTFKMGRSDGMPNEKPEHSVTVRDFWMDKTEISNAEYFEFVKEMNYKPTPSNWEKDKHLANEENMPVRYVSVDDANAFAAWRSKRDGVSYRLPTEEEWEFAARNGAKNNLYPWGDKFEAKCAVTDQPNTEPKSVGTSSCPNDWGIQDLIGNVYEWTSSKARLYPGSNGAILESAEPRNMIRGGAALNKSTGNLAITSTFRADVPVTTRSKEIGFRLVRSD
jgi:formylglycine-generating enzyme required for sulfatase activity